MSEKKSGFVPPQPGQMALYVCENCGEHFMRKMPLVFDLGIKCPAGGSFKARRDAKVRWSIWGMILYRHFRQSCRNFLILSQSVDI